MKTYTVLFVDDEPNILNFLKRLLHVEPYRILLAGSGDEALDLMELERVDIVVTDLNMPGMNGLNLLARIQERHPDVIRLVLSGAGDSNSILIAINKGNVYRYIVKPLEEKEIKTTIRQAIEFYHLQQENRKLLEQLTEANQFLEDRVETRTQQLLAIESNAEIGKYASQIVHNLMNSLQTILLALDLADGWTQKENNDPEKLRKYLNYIKESATDLENIIAGILLNSKDEKLCRMEMIDINEFIKKEFEYYNINPVFKYTITKETDLQDNLPLIQANKIQIKQIFDNLIQNAIHAMEGSEVKVLRVNTALEDGAIKITISDTGAGISEEHLKKIYSPDFTTKPVEKGTGLGLASVKRMVEAYDWEISVESTVDKGTSFVLSIPLMNALPVG